MKQVFDGDAIGTALGEEHRELAMDPRQPQWKGFGRPGGRVQPLEEPGSDDPIERAMQVAGARLASQRLW